MSRMVRFLLSILFLFGGRFAAAESSEKTTGAQNGSAAQFDRRLPPVIPGEEIPDGENTIKVWSTGGQVVDRRDTSTHNDSLGGIIVDTRSRQDFLGGDAVSPPNRPTSRE